MKVAVIIKHKFRDYDYRVDIYNVDDKCSETEIEEHVNSKMIGPFEIIKITTRLNFYKYDSQTPHKSSDNDE